MDASANSSGFSKKSRRSRQGLCLLKKSGYEDSAKAPKTRYEREMKTYIRPNGRPEKSSRTPVRRSESRPKSKESPLEHPFATKLGAMWSGTAGIDEQPEGKKAAKLKKKHEADIAASRPKGKPNAAENRVVRAEKSKKKKEEEDEEEDDDEISWF
ncbi:hypothetical protein U0070_001258 [Myodes glareolus]|uniref:Uncharacterized protein n=1 Tax=Myodes glareolus TaxID=447135 RepID=A0AAW0HCH3_MYOGA|nr:high mobility group protein B1-like [Myodes glareolus]